MPLRARRSSVGQLTTKRIVSFRYNTCLVKTEHVIAKLLSSVDTPIG